MAVLEIRRFGDPILRQVCKKITVIDEPIQRLIDDMIETMRVNRGVGLAAPQVGVPIRLTVIELRDGREPYVLINPEIVKRRGKRIVTEGCLSLPGWFGDVVRSESIVFRARDRHGREYKMSATDLLAQAVEHEVDHLNGILFTDPGRLVSTDTLHKVPLRDDAPEEAEEPEATPVV
ncbi:MAG: peptide deformylase [Chloroflexota bacterium]|nr:peptide deformylase [Dehalococcoidia bacterium]MDW8254849.1 peptide deformylase [Chloroflexota bacterium]